MLQQIPVSNAPNQVFAVSLNVDGNALTLNLAIRYDDMAGCWIMTISDVNNNLLIDSVPLLAGAYPAANLLEQQRYLAIGSWFIINASNTNESSVASGEGFGGIDYPDDTNLGTTFQLWVGDTPTV